MLVCQHIPRFAQLELRRTRRDRAAAVNCLQRPTVDGVPVFEPSGCEVVVRSLETGECLDSDEELPSIAAVVEAMPRLRFGLRQSWAVQMELSSLFCCGS